MTTVLNPLERGVADDSQASSPMATLRVPPKMLPEIVDVVDSTRRILGYAGRPSNVHDVDLGGAHRAMSDVIRSIADALGRCPWRSDTGGDHRALTDALLRAQAVNDRLLEVHTEHRNTSLARIRDVLRGLQSVSTVAELFERGTDAVCELGFDRCLIGRIEDGYWVADGFSGRESSDWISELRELAKANPQVLHPVLFETEMVRRRQPIMVSNVEKGSPRVHETLAPLARSHSYVAAPITSDDEVVGLIHADYCFQRRDVDTFDRDILMMFTEGFSCLLQRTLLMERLESLRTILADLSGSLTKPADPSILSTVRVERQPHAVQPHGHAMASPTPTVSLDNLLTPRERDVMRLVARGATNGQVARRLVLSEGTVKWHIQNVLRKLGASNRAAAVSYWLVNQQP